MVDILVFGAHPDDIEFGCGGILAKMASQGKTIVMVDLTLGEKGTLGTPKMRQEESIAAARVIGAERVFLEFEDCEIFDTYEGRLSLVNVIRQYQPRLVLAPYWKGEQTHPDHLACGRMARYACRYARFAKILPNIPIHRPEGILHYPYLSCQEVDFIIDISPQVDLWKKMMACYQSQHGLHDYSEWNLRVAAQYGLMIRKPYAQALIKGNPIEVDDIMLVAKGSAEI